MDKLNVFVSSKEKELECERLIAIKIIEFLGFQVISSEDRSPKSYSMEERNAKEVRSSNIYIGIFYKNYSLPTIKEFRIAKDNMIAQLVFIKENNGEPREEALEEFIEEIRNSEGGLVTQSFKNIVDFEDKIKKAIMELLSENYIENTKIQLESSMSDSISIIDMDRLTETRDLSDTELIKFSFDISYKFKNSINVVSASVSKIIANEPIKINAYIEGTITNGFLDLVIIDGDKNNLWFPDNKSFDFTKDTGTLILNNGIYIGEWEYKVPSYINNLLRIFFIDFRR